MSLRNPDAPPSAGRASWPGRPAGRQSGPNSRLLAACLASALLVPLLVAWALPPALDWGRFRTGIAAIAAAQLGRPVVISGEVTLRLLPEAVLTASGVNLPDQGDGVSASLSTLRLQVAVLPLLAGRIRPRDLVLGAPLVRLPWPLPDSLVRPARGRVPHAFAAHIENGTLRVGGAQITGINAGIHDGPVSSATAGAEPIAAGFGAEGFAAFAGRTWRFTGALGIPDADGVAALDLAVGGQGVAARTNGTVQGTLAEGVVQGRLRAGGPDLSLLLPAAPLPWQADAPFVASGTGVEAASIAVTLGGSPAEASLSLRVAAPARLDGRVHAASLDLDRWVYVLGAGAGGEAPLAARLAGRIEVTADAGSLLGGTLSGLHGILASDGTSLALDHAGAILPGQAKLDIGGAIARSAGRLRIDGPARLTAPDLRSTLRWLHGLAPALVDNLPAGVFRRATLAGDISLEPGSLSITRLTGQLDDTRLTGGFGVKLGARSNLRASLSMDRLNLDDWLGTGWPTPGAFARTAGAWSQFDSDIHLDVADTALHGIAVHTLALDAHADNAGVRLDRATAELSGAHLTISGAAGTDGTLADGKIRATAGDAASLRAVLPVEWPWTTGFWHGPATMEAILAGPPGALAAQFRADIGDLVAEAELRGDIDRRIASGSLTLRHPGAPRLLASLGLSGVEQWLNTGSLAVRTQWAMRPGEVSVQDFDLVAADLRLGGSLDLDFIGAEPMLHGRIDAQSLVLPGWAGLARFDPAWLRGLSAGLDVRAERVAIGGVDVAASLQAGLQLGSEMALLDISQALVAGGRVAGQWVLDADGSTPAAAMHGEATGLQVPAPLTGWPIDLTSGKLDVVVDAEMAGGGSVVEALAGTARLALHDARLSGLDLAAARLAAASPGKLARPALQAALSQGTSEGMAGVATLDVAHGIARLAPTTLVSANGSLTVQGKADQTGLAMRLDVSATGASISQAGPWGGIRAVPDLGPAPVILRLKRRRR